jgi:hypothetical protein
LDGRANRQNKQHFPIREHVSTERWPNKRRQKKGDESEGRERTSTIANSQQPAASTVTAHAERGDVHQRTVPKGASTGLEPWQAQRLLDNAPCALCREATISIAPLTNTSWPRKARDSLARMSILRPVRRSFVTAKVRCCVIPRKLSDRSEGSVAVTSSTSLTVLRTSPTTRSPYSAANSVENSHDPPGREKRRLQAGLANLTSAKAFSQPRVIAPD